GDDLAARGDLDGALDRYDRAQVLQPDNVELEYRIATVLDKQLRPIEALIRYQLFLHRLELEKIEAVGDAYAQLADAVRGACWRSRSAAVPDCSARSTSRRAGCARGTTDCAACWRAGGRTRRSSSSCRKARRTPATRCCVRCTRAPSRITRGSTRRAAPRSSWRSCWPTPATPRASPAARSRSSRATARSPSSRLPPSGC